MKIHLAEMIAKAKGRLPECEFAMADIGSGSRIKNADLLYANASMQWLPDMLAVSQIGGQSSAQAVHSRYRCRTIWRQATHVAMREVARPTSVGAREMAEADATRSQVGTLHFISIATPVTGRRIDIWRTTYHHPLQGLEGIIEWFKGTGIPSISFVA